ncbi:MAG: thiolase family protein [Desulfurococcales archaeon]|nr:thiolase family protein [Desulfurococcales archaeon]
MEVYITGVGLTKVGRHFDLSLRELAARAAFEALDSARIDKVDAVVVASTLSYREAGQFDLAGHLAGALGLKGAQTLAMEAGDASGLAAVEAACSLIRAGSAERVLVVGVDKLTDYVSSRVYRDLQRLYEAEVQALYDIGHAGVAGLLARLYMERYGVGRDTLSYWPAMDHSHAKHNPYAMLPFAIDPAAVPRALKVAEPLTLLDSFPLGDGAAALVLESEPHGDARAKVVLATSAAGYPSFTMNEDPLAPESVGEVAARLREVTGIAPANVDVIELGDTFTSIGVILAESLGLSKPGRAAVDAMEGRFTLGGDGPVVNPSGGLKARGHPVGATGVYMVGELALQLSGEYPGLRVDGARRGLAVMASGDGSSAHLVLVEGVA